MFFFSQLNKSSLLAVFRSPRHPEHAHTTYMLKEKKYENVDFRQKTT